jgi:hypothetical protein
MKIKGQKVSFAVREGLSAAIRSGSWPAQPARLAICHGCGGRISRYYQRMYIWYLSIRAQSTLSSPSAVAPRRGWAST